MVWTFVQSCNQFPKKIAGALPATLHRGGKGQEQGVAGVVGEVVVEGVEGVEGDDHQDSHQEELQDTKVRRHRRFLTFELFPGLGQSQKAAVQLALVWTQEDDDFMVL